MRGATVNPQIAASMFPAPKPTEPDTPQQPNTSRRRAETVKSTRKRSTTSDDFGDDGLDDEALMKAGVADLEFEHIENFANPTDAITRKNTAKNKPAKGKTLVKPTSMATEADVQEPVQLANGKWACNHKCKDRIACKHLCCKEGLDKPPKKSAAKPVVLGETRAQPSQVVSTQKPKETQTKLQLTASKRKTSTFIEEIDLTQEEKKKKINYAATGPMDYRELHQLHKTIQKTDLPSTLHSVMHKKPEYCYSQGGEHALSFMDQYRNERPGTTSDYGDVSADDFASHFEPSQKHPSAQDIVPLSNGLYEDALNDYPATAPVASRGSDTFGDDDSLLGDAMIGLADSQNLQKMDRSYDDVMGPLEDALNDEFEAGFQDDDFPTDIDFTVGDNGSWDGKDGARAMTPASASKPAVQRPRAPFFDSSSSRKSQHNCFKPAKIILEDPEITKLTQPKVADGTSRQLSSDKAVVISDFEVLDLANMFDDAPLEDKPVPKAFEGLEPWLFQEFGDIVEIVEE
jgi:ATP-dependent DNA helicase HFM1/MER3